MSIPYAGAIAGTKAREEIKKILLRFGCESIGFMDDYNDHKVLLAFTYHGRQVQFPFSARGWAAMYLREKPYTSRMRRSRQEHEAAALQQGHIAVNSEMRDLIKSYITTIESGALSFEALFMPFMLTNDGRPLIDRIRDEHLLPPPQEPKVVAMQRG